MKAAVYSGPGSLNIVDRKVPEPATGWVRIGVTAVGICGSDLHIFGGMLGDITGLQPGHEVAGVIDAVGEGVTLMTGMNVALEPITACGNCHQCATGHRNRCAKHRLFGVTARGGMAEYLSVPAECLHALPADLNSNVAALAEPMAVCVRGARRARIALGDRVAVLGGGTIGLLSALAARESGAREVFVTARYPHQRALAQSLGVTRAFATIEEMIDAIGPESMDVVIETVGGKSDALTEAVSVVARGGTIAMLGVFDGSPRIPGLPFADRELTLVGSYCYGRDSRIGDFAYATELLSKHRSQLPELVTHKFKLDEVSRAFEVAADKKSGSIKVQIEP
ncbi:MAG TPA: alcohol dehydrogenase catalytic domain-containing protein [Pseudomonadales bacterium]|nr:alcohol dehydrogenase catalytic domain-containing protein [Pseudomonadales bacterium]